MDDVPEIVAGPVAPVVRVEPSIEPSPKHLLRVERQPVMDDHVIPSHLFDLQPGSAKCRADGFEMERSVSQEVDDLWSAIVADKIRASQRTEQLGAGLELELHFGFATDAVPSLF